MTEQQYKKYSRIKEEIQPMKDFLECCGKKYKNSFFGKYRFSISLYKKCYHNSVVDNLYEIPLELQDQIIETIEKYIDEKEKELEGI